MKSFKSYYGYVLLGLVILLSSCNGQKEASFKDIASMPKEAGKSFALKIEKEIVLKSSPDIIGFIMVFKIAGENFLIIDPIHARQCYLFDNTGMLKRKVGKYGEGPAEYMNVFAGCVSSDRIFLIGMLKIHIYTIDGEFIKTAKRAFLGICNNAYEGPNGSIYAVSYNRYNTTKDTIYQIDKEGRLVKSFSPIEDIPPVFDTFFPQAGILLEEKGIFQFFNYKYQVTLLDYNGNKIKDIRLSSPFYTPPDLGDAKAIQGHKAEKEYRSTFTQFCGFYAFSKGYVTLLTNWKNTKESQNIYEFWNKDFERMGFVELSNDELPLGVYNDKIVTADFEKETKIIFRAIKF
jgi:hypothetical protein